jgi:hypothetical protein
VSVGTFRAFNVIGRDVAPQNAYHSKLAITTEGDMSDGEQTDTTSNSEPLFVLKYRNGSTAAFVTACLVLASICGIALFAMPLDRSSLVSSLSVKLLCGFLFLLFVVSPIELILFNEIRLYSDRIVKVRCFLRDTEVDLADAKYSVDGNAVAILSRNAGRLWPIFQGVVYSCGLVNPEDHKKMIFFLARLSGRTTEEFVSAPGLFGSKEFLKKGTALRSIEMESVEEDFQRKQARDKEFDRVATIGLVVHVVLLSLGLLLVAYFSLWKPAAKVLW